ncbi:16S rRNA (uracil(1498)-N(3))-methyltransferase [Bifidobacterium crudilactis]|jgi:16S rRNA (uracil1498-N3)-methyltransferase|uniref:Ribosomal RNA small subunit methyltransferase E n=1 Tax=Bifidobacterium crudilactis TaxID=327277 RepID=A0A971CZZ4_9BIFI|nr:16S rRNA (uracil(1498)-N(3))-methyltransferase [Bifidobacterium crudilactis]MCI1867782.1 16S rRNA (uracil(1498)-N(3))-methyltransferase [Bifidobacterium crudilactis]NLT80230.1 16S rRNA (uracil(1498)-N(3))-methyltransferase [Bifidobacterium crudilactis]
MTEALFLFDPTSDDAHIQSDELHSGWNITLPQSVRRHAIQVMRLGRGDELELSDGKGLRIQARIENEQSGVVKIISVGKEDRPVLRLALIQALAKGGHDEQAIDMATQIGADAIVPWQSARSIARWKEGRTDRKWAQTLQSATEQSRRSWLPELADHVSSKQIVAICQRANVHGDVVIVLHQDATETWSQIEDAVNDMAARSLADARPRTVSVVVGPEGGISDEEIGMFRDAGAKCCVLGSNILRASCAGAVALSLLSRTLGRWS